MRSSEAAPPTAFASLEQFEHGRLDLVDDDGRRYAFSNLFAVAADAPPYRKIAVAQNFEYVLEAVRAEGASDWWASPHDEFALVMDGAVAVELLDPSEPACDPSGRGAIRLGVPPAGQPMGRVVARRGHMVLLPAGRCYRFLAERPSVILLQTIAGPHTEYRWREICDPASGANP